MSKEVCYELPPFFKKYKDGRVERLQGTDVVPPSFDPKTGVESKDIVILAESIIPARLYKPKTICPSEKLPIMFYFHGGGFFVHTPFNSTFNNFQNALVAEANVIMVSIHYSRPPEEPLPMAYDDSWAAIKWVASHFDGGCAAGRDEWFMDFADPKRVFFVGDSAGANIAHNMGMWAGTEKMKALKFRGIALLCPYFWGVHPLPGEIREKEKREVYDKWWGIACPSTTGSDDPRINPLADSKLCTLGCHSILIWVAENDDFKYRGCYYGDTLGKNGWKGKVEIMETKNQGHVFFLNDPDSKDARVLIKKVASYLKGC